MQLVAASHTYARLQGLRGKVRFTRTLVDLKADRTSLFHVSFRPDLAIGIIALP